MNPQGSNTLSVLLTKTSDKGHNLHPAFSTEGAEPPTKFSEKGGEGA